MVPHTSPPSRTVLVLCVGALVTFGCSKAQKAPEHEPGLLSDHAARFVPEDTSLDMILPSFALDGLRRAMGPVPEGWGPTPTFTLEDDTYFARIAIEPGTDLYGTGEIAGPLLRNGARTQAWTEMPNPSTGGPGGLAYDDRHNHLYQAHPWVLAVRADGSAFGVLADTTRRTWMDLTDGIRFEAPAPFPIVVIQGASPEEVLRELANLTGHLDMPPRWALGHHQSRFSYPDAAAMRAVASDLREHEIPTDVLWFDGAYMDGYRLFTFDDEAFPNAPDLISELHDMGYRVVPIFDPGVTIDETFPLYQEALEQDMLLKRPDGSIYQGVVWGSQQYAFPDYSSRATREWWTRRMGDFLVSSGFDGIWDDMNEPVIYGVVRWGLPEDLPTRGDDRYRAGTFTEYNSVYALQQLEASEAAFREAYPERRPFLLTRANYIGGQRHSATWTGDNTHSWDHLLWSIAMIQNLGLSGQPFSGADIGGFFMPAGMREARDPELFVHWIGIGAFYPFCRNHSAGLDDAFTRQFGGGPSQHAWEFGPEIEQVYRQAVERRYRLLPYLYTLMRNASHEGALAIQPVFFASPGEARLRAEDRAFLFGPDLLIVPHWPEGTIDNTSPLELPNGFDREITLVGETPDVDVALPRIRIRNGAIVPTGVVGQTTAYDPSSPLDLYISLDDNGAATGTLYEDEGEGHGYLDGEYRLITLRAETVDGEVIVTLQRDSGDLELPSRVVRAHLYRDGGVTTVEGMTDRVEIAAVP